MTRHPRSMPDETHRDAENGGSGPVRGVSALAVGAAAGGLISLVIAATAAVIDGIQWYAVPLTGVGIVLIAVAVVLVATAGRRTR